VRFRAPLQTDPSAEHHLDRTELFDRRITTSSTAVQDQHHQPQTADHLIPKPEVLSTPRLRVGSKDKQKPPSTPKTTWVSVRLPINRSSILPPLKSPAAETAKADINNSGRFNEVPSSSFSYHVCSISGSTRLAIDQIGDVIGEL
jgi:hypothetical protein